MPMHTPTSRFLALTVTGLCGSLLVALSGSPLAAQQSGATAVTPAKGAAAARAGTSANPARERVEGSGPNGATIRCMDGSHPAPGAADSACETKGGLMLRYPLRRYPVQAPRAAVKPAPAPPALPVDSATQATLRAVQAEQPSGSRANVFVPAPRPPADARLQCADGSFVVSDTSSTRCSGRGGVLVRFPVPPRRAPR